MESHDAGWIDENVTAKLARVGAGVSRQAAASKFLRVGQPGPDPPDISETPPIHAVGTVQRAVLVEENRPGDSCVGDVGANGRRGLERDHGDPDSQFLEFPLMLLQLQQVPAAGQSTQVAVEHQQEPLTLIIGQTACASLGVRQFEGNRCPSS